MVWIWRSGLLSSRSNSPLPTFFPDSEASRSTRALACAVIQRMCSGTRVPGPRTSRTTSPLRTLSISTAERSMVIDAGSRLRVQAVTATSTRTPNPIIRLRFLLPRGVRTISISQPAQS